MNSLPKYGTISIRKSWRCICIATSIYTCRKIATTKSKSPTMNRPILLKHPILTIGLRIRKMPRKPKYCASSSNAFIACLTSKRRGQSWRVCIGRWPRISKKRHIVFERNASASLALCRVMNRQRFLLASILLAKPRQCVRRRKPNSTFVLIRLARSWQLRSSPTTNQIRKNAILKKYYLKFRIPKRFAFNSCR